jgi:hypothetical protein
MANIITAGNSTNGGTAISTDTSGTLNIVTGSGSGATAISVDTSQNVGVGTTTPAAKLNVKTTDGTNPAIIAGTTIGARYSTDASGIYIEGTDPTGGVSYQPLYTGGSIWGVRISGTEKARIDSSGNLLIGTTSNGGLTGNIVCPAIYSRTSAIAANIGMDAAGGFFRSTSAMKYKQDVRDLESVDINLLRPVRYKSKCEGDDQTKDHLGLIADEVSQAGFEELVTRGAEGEIEGFQYERLTVILLKSIQELKAELDALKAKVGE